MNLGELEKAVLQYLWQNQPADAKQVHGYFSTSRTSSLNTIQSALDRLYKKGLLSRKKQGHAFQYSTKADRETFVGQLMNEVAADFIPKETDRLKAAFVSLTESVSDSDLDQLEQLIQQRRQQK